jgi:hypothetical protein
VALARRPFARASFRTHAAAFAVAVFYLFLRRQSAKRYCRRWHTACEKHKAVLFIKSLAIFYTASELLVMSLFEMSSRPENEARHWTHIEKKFAPGAREGSYRMTI